MARTPNINEGKKVIANLQKYADSIHNLMKPEMGDQDDNSEDDGIEGENDNFYIQKDDKKFQ